MLRAEQHSGMAISTTSPASWLFVFLTYATLPNSYFFQSSVRYSVFYSVLTVSIFHIASILLVQGEGLSDPVKTRRKELLKEKKKMVSGPFAYTVRLSSIPSRQATLLHCMYLYNPDSLLFVPDI